MDFIIGEVHPNTPHLFADLAELVLALGYNGRTNLHKNDLLSVLENGNISPDELDQEEDAETEAESTHQSSAEKHSRREIQLENILTQLAYRANTFNCYYPFKLDQDELVSVETTNLSEKQRVYRFLLACSRLRSFDNNGIRQRWAKYFTELSKIAMCGLLPYHATVRIFDANSSDRNTYYTTDLRKALRILGKDLALHIIEKECDKSGPSGDAGLDLVGIINFDDGATTSFALLGQCGAQGEAWPKKTLEAHSINFRHLFNMQNDFPNFMFTPVSYRSADGSWTDNRVANGTFVIDRERLLNLLEKQNNWTEIITSDWFIDFEKELYKLKIQD